MIKKNPYVNAVLTLFLFSMLVLYGFVKYKSAEQQAEQRSEECFTKNKARISATREAMKKAQSGDIVVINDETLCIITTISSETYHCKSPDGDALHLRSMSQCTDFLEIDRVVHYGETEYTSLAAQFLQKYAQRGTR